MGGAVNLEGTRNSRLFQLRMGKVMFSGEPRADLDRFGESGYSSEGVPAGQGETAESWLRNYFRLTSSAIPARRISEVITLCSL